MDFHFRRPELRDIERARGEALSLGVFADERPLRGLAGLLDWRLCGRLSRLISEDVFSGGYGERMLLPSHGRLAFEKVFVHGLGAKADFDLERLECVVSAMLGTLAQAHARSSALSLPGRGLFERTEAMTQLLRVADDYPDIDELCLAESLEDERALTTIVEGERRRARALAGRDES